MPLNRILPVMLAIALGGCGSIGAIGLPPMNRSDPPPDTLAGGLPPPLPGEDPNAVAPAATGDAIISEPLPNPGDGTATVAAAPPPSTGGGIGRTDLLGGWTIAASGDSCQLFMTLTSWTGGYRASTRGCSSDVLKSISAWNLSGKQVTLSGQGGSPVATLNAAGSNRFDGQTGGGVPVSFYR